MITIPQWLQDTGCTISKSGKVQKYLGAPFGHQIKPTDMYKFCLNQISKRILGWENRLLTFTEKVLLIQHVLQSITMYHMMYSSALVIVLQQINKLFKYFLWGFDKVTKRRKNSIGGMEKTYMTQGARARAQALLIEIPMYKLALLSKWVLKAILDPSTEWAQLFLTLFEDFTWEHRRSINKVQYTSLHHIMLGTVCTYRLMTYTSSIWKAWAALRCHLLLSPIDNVLLAHQRIKEVVESLPLFAYMTKNTQKSLVCSSFGRTWYHQNGQPLGAQQQHLGRF